ncbi:ABC transporter ATP-binding protein [Endozoicomonas atrinae]|uniref:ABC transporter ATP-binding protein n=1 Tax=Endozoicomonas atrinae TaxID=1333660 RepID=UPI0008257210|nr:ABC transporter ATP-binding protein [Endozoicomonas atrinae]
MSYIKLKNVSLEYPIYNSESTSLKRDIIKFTTGGLITRRKKKITTVKALSNINLEITSGTRLGIVGHNGSGKSTLLRCISGIFRPTKGTVSISGTISTLLEIGAGIEPELSGYDNIKRLLYLRSISYNDVKKISQHIAEFSELGEFLSFPVRTYSSGMMMRLMFSVSTAQSPDILIMDEFFSVGDDSFQEKAEKKIISHINNSSILVFASHSEELLKKFCNRFIRLNHGELENIDL